SALPPPALTFSLLSAPASATLIKNNSNNAIFNWRPLVSNANATNLIILKVADNAIPSLSATQSFQIVVNPLAFPLLTAPILNNGQASLSVTGQQGPDYTLWASTNLVNWQVIQTSNSPPIPVTFVDTNFAMYPERFYRIQIGP